MVFLDLGMTLLVSLVAATVFMSLIFVVGRRLHRYDVVDVAWGLVFIVIAVAALVFNQTYYSASVLVLGLITIWGLRLSYHIAQRIRATTVEDKRYVAMRAKWQSGNKDLVIYLRIYLTQALLATFVSLPVLVIAVAPIAIPSPLIIIGLLLWLAGFSIEALADQQLRRFIRNPAHKGQLMTAGLWRYSRHPNYFGELTQWWAIGLIGLAVPLGWLGLLGPLLISYLIIFVSGVPPMEKAFAGRAGWDEYRRRTSVLIPWFVKADGAK